MQALFVCILLTAAQQPTPPVAKSVPYTRTVHGDAFVDPFFWLKDKTNPDTIAYLEAENAYTKAVTARLKPVEDKLYAEMLGRIKQTDLSVPYRKRGDFFYRQTIEGKQYPVYYRKRKNLDATAEVLLDVNQLAEGRKFCSAIPAAVSDDGTKLAYIADFTGFREYHIYVKDVTTGQLLTDQPLAKSSNVTWAGDNQTLFYVTEDAAKRPHKLYRHRLGGEPELIYDEKDELYRLSVRRSRDDKFIFIDSGSATTTEERYLPADKPTANPAVILPRENGHEYSTDHRNGRFYIRTNKNAPNYKLVTTSVNDPSQASWTELVSHRGDVLLEGATLFKDHAVLVEREGGLSQFTVLDLKNGGSHRVTFPEPTYDASPEANAEFNTNQFRYSYDSMVSPETIFDYDLDTREKTVLKRQEVLGGYDSAKYQSERITATAKDGTKIPISLVYRKGTPRDGTAPGLLYGYGSYGATIPAGFSSQVVSLLDRGGVYAIAHIRGGKDMGQHWHDQGKMKNKMNTFTDFIACADHLVNQKYINRDRLGIRGGSAGGLLMGAVLNIRPDVAKCAIVEVPFVDVINTMLDPNLPLTVQEYLEWGNPNVKDEYEVLKSYCPYTNMAAKEYPSMLVTTSLNDSQVMYHEPAKYVARLRTLKTDKNPLLFKCNMAGGHGGSSGRYDNLREEAFKAAFLFDQLGVRDQ